MSNSDSEKKGKSLSDSHKNQLAVLKTLSARVESSKDNTKHYDIHEIAQMSGLKDEKEVQRYLYILEGQKLVSPHPEGDFTSKYWQITADGITVIDNSNKVSQ
ncbi:MAG: hypothetical protein KDD56_00315 [Bdellovibrionales bacterium]|nr:hypothetical protein [Bdellovibrionales bacterium]